MIVGGSIITYQFQPVHIIDVSIGSHIGATLITTITVYGFAFIGGGHLFFEVEVVPPQELPVVL